MLLIEMEQRASTCRAHPRKNGITRDLISSFKAYARKKKSIYLKKSAYWVPGKALTIPRHRAVQQNTPRFRPRSATLTGQLSPVPVF